MQNPLDREHKTSPPDAEHSAGNPLDEAFETESPQDEVPTTLLKDLQMRHTNTFQNFWKEEEVSLLNDGLTRDSNSLRPQRKESAKDTDNAIARLVNVTPILEPSTTRTPRERLQMAMPLGW